MKKISVLIVIIILLGTSYFIYAKSSCVTPYQGIFVITKDSSGTLSDAKQCRYVGWRKSTYSKALENKNTYKNSTYGFTFEYPNGWVLDHEEQNRLVLKDAITSEKYKNVPSEGVTPINIIFEKNSDTPTSWAKNQKIINTYIGVVRNPTTKSLDSIDTSKVVSAYKFEAINEINEIPGVAFRKYDMNYAIIGLNEAAVKSILSSMAFEEINSVEQEYTKNEKAERITINSLIASWKTVSKTFSVKAGESGSFNLPDKIQFISSDTMLVHYDDGLIDHMSVVRMKGNSFVELKNVGVMSLLPNDSWLELVKKYGDVNYRGQNYQNYDGKGWVNVPENIFVVHLPA